MSLRSLANGQIKLAFRMAKDLMVDGVFTQNTPTPFNFSSGSETATAQTPLVVKGFFTNIKNNPRVASSTLQATFICQSGSLSMTSVFDRVVINGITWNILPGWVDDTFILTLNLARRA